MVAVCIASSASSSVVIALSLVVVAILAALAVPPSWRGRVGLRIAVGLAVGGVIFHCDPVWKWLGLCG